MDSRVNFSHLYQIFGLLLPESFLNLESVSLNPVDRNRELHLPGELATTAGFRLRQAVIGALRASGVPEGGLPENLIYIPLGILAADIDPSAGDVLL
ncbi:hypothetical protein [Nitrosospira briensis]|uniref:hypothetical protein n=1 Tax=Nitrosospira briensis TaxID=35799 RepID=UPI00046A5620|nr:hypothetical protein [Nitrosospira briensis]